MEFPGGSDNYLAITGAAHPFLTGAETFHTPSLGDEEFEIPPIALDADPSLAVADVVGHFEDLGEAGGGAEPPFPPPPYGVQGLEMPVGMGHGLMEQGGGLLAGGLAMELDPPLGAQYSAPPAVTIDVPMAALSPGGLLGPPAHLTTIDQSELTSQLGLGLGGGGGGGAPPAAAGGPQGGAPNLTPPPAAPPAAPSPEERLSPTPSPTGSLQEEEPEDFRRAAPPKPSPPSLPAPAPPGEGPRRGKPPKKPKKKKDPNEPQKPVSAYALFFRDTQAAIKGQNPNATFGDVSKIVASMWDSLGEEQKQVYKRKTEAAKKEYLKALTAYRALQTSTEPPEPEPSPPPPPQPVPPPSSSPPSSSSPDPPPAPAPAPAAPSPNPTPPPPLTKIIIPKQMLPPSLTVAPQSGGVVTVIPATVVTSRGGTAAAAGGGGSRGAAPVHFAAGTPTQIVTRSVLQAAAAQLPRLQPPPLQQMPPPQPPPQQVTVLQPPPPLQAMQQPPPPKIRLNLPQNPPPLQIKILPPPTLQITPLHLPPDEIGGGASSSPPPSAPPNPAAPQISAGAASPSETVEVMGDVVPEVESPPPLAVELVAESPAPADSPRPRCVRAGCANAPVASSDWDEEYCSSECVVKHCRDVFLAWLAARNAGNSVVFVK